MKFFNKTRDEMIEWCKSNPGVIVQKIGFYKNSGMDDTGSVVTASGELFESYSAWSDNYIDWQVATWSPVKPILDWTKVCVECEGRGQEVAEWLSRMTGAIEFDAPLSDPAVACVMYDGADNVVLWDVAENICIAHENDYTVISYDYWLAVKDEQAPAKAIPCWEGVRYAPGYTTEAFISSSLFDTYGAAILTIQEPDKYDSAIFPTMTRDQAHELDGAAFTDWVRANRDAVGIRASWQTAAEKEVQLISEVKRGRK